MHEQNQIVVSNTPIFDMWCQEFFDNTGKRFESLLSDAPVRLRPAVQQLQFEEEREPEKTAQITEVSDVDENGVPEEVLVDTSSWVAKVTPEPLWVNRGVSLKRKPSLVLEDFGEEGYITQPSREILERVEVGLRKLNTVPSIIPVKHDTATQE